METAEMGKNELGWSRGMIPVCHAGGAGSIPAPSANMKMRFKALPPETGGTFEAPNLVTINTYWIKGYYLPTIIEIITEETLHYAIYQLEPNLNMMQEERLVHLMGDRRLSNIQLYGSE